MYNFSDQCSPRAVGPLPAGETRVARPVRCVPTRGREEGVFVPRLQRRQRAQPAGQEDLPAHAHQPDSAVCQGKGQC